MRFIATSTYPTRYVANDHPRTWVQHEAPTPSERRTEFEPAFRGGFEVACYRDPWPSTHHPTLWHGIDIDVLAHASGGVVLDCNVTHADWGRTASRYTQWLKGPDAVRVARELAEEWLAGVLADDGQVSLFGEAL